MKQGIKQLIVLLTLGLIASINAQTATCGVEGETETTIYLPAVAESTGGGYLLGRFQLYNVNTSTAIGNPFNKYTVAQRYPNGVYEILTQETFHELISTERVSVFERQSRLHCLDGSDVLYTFVIEVTDENDNAPEFDKPSYDLVVELPLNGAGGVTFTPTDIVVTDADYEFANADLYITGSNRYFHPTLERRWLEDYPPVYNFSVNYWIDNDVPIGTYNTVLLVDDHIHQTNATVNIVVKEGPPITEPTEPTTTTTTTEEPPTTTTEEPTTTEEITEEPTTEVPTTEVPTTESEEPSTPEVEPTIGPTTTTTTTPKPQSCGIVGQDAGTIILPSVDPNAEPGTEIWRVNTYNVVKTVGVSHPHNVYLDPFRLTSQYFILLSDRFPRFQEEQGTDTILRTVRFECDDLTSVNYNLEVPLEV